MNEMSRLLFVRTDVKMMYVFVCRPPSHLPLQHTSLLRATSERQNQSEEEACARHHVVTEGRQRKKKETHRHYVTTYIYADIRLNTTFYKPCLPARVATLN